MAKKLITLVVVIIVCGTILNVLNFYKKGRFLWESPEPPKTLEEKVTEKNDERREHQVKYLATILRHSFRSDPKELLLVALAVQNTGQLRKKDNEWIFRNAGEMIPPWSTKTTYVRWAWVVRGLASKNEKAAADSLAEQMVAGKFSEPYATIMQNLKDSERCVTTFYRPEGNKDPQIVDDLALMRKWKPKAYTASDGAFWLCLPLTKPDKIPE